MQITPFGMFAPLRLLGVVLAVLLFIIVPQQRLLAACSEEAKAKMIMNNVSQETIEKTCGSPKSATSQSNPALGIRVAATSPALAKQYGFPAGPQGVVVVELTPKGLGDKAGLHKGDLIMLVNNSGVTSAAQFNSLVRSEGAGSIKVTLMRGAAGSTKVLELQKERQASSSATVQPRVRKTTGVQHKEKSQIPGFTMAMGIVAGIWGYVNQQSAIDDANFASSINDKKSYNAAKRDYENAVTLQKQALGVFLLGMWLDSAMNGPATGTSSNWHWAPRVDPLGQVQALRMEYKW